MKLTLTALTIVASLIAGMALAFDINLTEEEENKLRGNPMVGDLAAGVKGLLSMYSLGCLRNSKLYLYSSEALETDPVDYFSYYEIVKQPDGGFILTYKNANSVALNGDDEKRIPGTASLLCDNIIEESPGVTFYPIKSINGFTDKRSFIIDLINQGYK